VKLEQMRNSWKYQSDVFKAGVKTTGLGLAAIALTYIRVISSSWRTHGWESFTYIIGGLAVVVGIIMIMLDILPRIRKK
jgi:hypothetical protein